MLTYVPELSDYFDKFGFGDGDYQDAGYECLSVAKDVLEEHLKPFGITVGIDPCLGMHNNCRLKFEPVTVPSGLDGGQYRKDLLGISESDEMFLEETWEAVFLPEGEDEASPAVEAQAKAVVAALGGAVRAFADQVGPDPAEVLEAILERPEVFPVLLGIHGGLDRMMEERLQSEKAEENG